MNRSCALPCLQNLSSCTAYAIAVSGFQEIERGVRACKTRRVRILRLFSGKTSPDPGLKEHSHMQKGGLLQMASTRIFAAGIWL